ncbi:putative Vacuolar protein sorting-associated protein 18 like protein [Blattamonas nauphoetae]|uniref:Vacuolar protein sorting-associated protein 18 like protein n=1 Tax=Blattamonas nauphoetae TaxID=2049346 RepID=A0ABQ9YKH8_9EUKA|nr:putative Vacuolar protein sorting-associated protein 18 like protein [Blattamonas nauphoetae]
MSNHAHQIVAANDVVFLVYDTYVVRWDSIREDTEIFSVSLRHAGEKIYKCCTDPSGTHLFFTTTGGDNYYVMHGGKVKLAKQLSRWKFVVESMVFIVPFNKMNEKGSGYVAPLHGSGIPPLQGMNWIILIGTQDGRLFETSLDSRSQTPTEILGQNTFSQIPISSLTGAIENIEGRSRIVVWASSIHLRLELYREKSDEPFTINSKATIAAPLGTVAANVGNPMSSDLSIGGTCNSNPVDERIRPIRASWFAWITPMGVYHQQFPSTVGFQSANPTDSALISFHQLPVVNVAQNQLPIHPPIGLAASETHFLVLYDDRVQVWSHLSGELLDDSVPIMKYIDRAGSQLPTLTSYRIKSKYSNEQSGSSASTTSMNPDGILAPTENILNITLVSMSQDTVTREIYITDGTSLYSARVGDEVKQQWAVYLGKAIELHRQFHEMNMLALEKEGRRQNYNEPLLDDQQVHQVASQFSLALTMCQTEKQRNLVKITQANCYFLSRRYSLAIERWGKSEREFEETVSSLIHLRKWNLLQEYLVQRHQSMDGKSEADSIAKSLLGTWIVGFYLDRIASNQALKKKKTDGPKKPPTNNISRELLRRLDQEMQKKMKQKPGLTLPFAEPERDPDEETLRLFLKENFGTLNKNVIYSMLQSHGALDVLADFAQCSEDTKTHIQQFITRGLYPEALYVLRLKEDPELYYQFSPELIQYRPDDLVKQWKRMSYPRLDPVRLIPSLSQYRPPAKVQYEKNSAINYLEYVIRDLHDQTPAVHNFYVLQLTRNAPEDKLIEFLKENEEPDTILGERKRCYDERYCLRVCMQYRCIRAAVHIYIQLNLFDEAVELALGVDFNLAKEAAKAAYGKTDPAMFQRLWIRIAKCVVDKKMENLSGSVVGSTSSQVSETLIHEILSECMQLRDESSDLQLALVDILPYFPDFFCIDDFRKEIDTSIKDFDSLSTRLGEEIQEQTKLREEMKQELTMLPFTRHFILPQDAKCAGCNKPLTSPQPLLVFETAQLTNRSQQLLTEVKLMSGLYSFPCHHSFHPNCAVKVLVETCNAEEKKALSAVIAHLTSSSATASTTASPSPSPSILTDFLSTTEDLRNSLFAKKDRAPKPSTSPMDSPFSVPESLPEPDVFVDFPLLSRPHTCDKQCIVDELDELIQSECPLCGERAIDYIAQPFITPAELSGGIMF